MEKKSESILYTITGVIFGALLILILAIAVKAELRPEDPDPVPTPTVVSEPPKPVEEVVVDPPIETVAPTEEPLEIVHEEVIQEEIVQEVVVQEDAVEVEPIIDGITFRVTAYCACEKCCGEWALNRPLNENGEPIVKGAAGKELIAEYSCASPLPFGTQIQLEGLGIVEVQDRTAKWVVDKYGEYIVDIYMSDHEAAWNFGLQYIEGKLIN